MKVSLLTRHAVINYGSLLQTIALSRAIEKLGHSCEVIDYIREDERDGKLAATSLAGKPDWSGSFLKRAVYLVVRWPENVIAGRRFGYERRRYLNLSDRYADVEWLSAKKPAADVYMTGSDQVWNVLGNGKHDFAYALSFTGDGDRRVSYAASFGRATLAEDVEVEYKRWLSRYEYLSVREDSGVRLLGEMGLRAERVLDPTFLLDRDEWNCFCETKKQTGGRYILVYQVQNDKSVGEYAACVAREKGLPLLRVSPLLHQSAREGRLVYLPSIGRFLSCVRHADCLITDSFHGTAFAINFNVPFVEVLPQNGSEVRNTSLLDLAGLSGRVLRNRNDTSLAFDPVDFSQANEVIARERARSIDILRNMIEGVVQ